MSSAMCNPCSSLHAVPRTFRCWFIAIACCASSFSTAFAQAPKDLNTPVPNQFHVLMETTQGNFTIEVKRDWSPQGADRFHKLVNSGFYNNAAFFRVVPGFIVQFGLNADPAEQKKWTNAKIEDDPVVASNKRGAVTFAMAGPHTRTTQMFINYADNTRLDGLGFAPLGMVIDGMDVVDKINAEHGEEPNQARITSGGNDYLKAQFPKLDYITRATIIKYKATDKAASDAK